MNALANVVIRRAWIVLGAVVIVVALGFISGVRPEPEDDILTFLPADDPDVNMFHRISATFGGLEVGMVGIETRDVFEPAFLKRLDSLTADLRDTDGVDRVVSLTNLADFEPDPEKRGIRAAELVDIRRFDNPSYVKNLRRRVLGKEHVVGQFVDRDGRSTLVMCFLVPGVNQQQVVRRIKQVVRRHMAREKVYWGGAPFMSAYIFESTNQDLVNLTPWALGAIILVMLLAFRDPIGVLLSLVTTGVGAVVCFSLMKGFGVKLNLVLSSTPVILFAVGSAYGIHILAHYYRLREKMEINEAVRGALIEVGPAVVATGLTTMAGFLSFMVMDIGPMRMFGLFTGIGIGASMITALCAIPAILVLAGRFRRSGGGKERRPSVLGRTIGAMAAATQRRRLITLTVASVLCVVGIVFAARIKVEVEPSAFFASGSEPDRADKFLGRRFGGSQFIQVHFDLEPASPDDRALAEAFSELGPQVRHKKKPLIEDPLVYREIRRFAEQAELLSGVSSALHMGLPLALGTEMADDLRRIPDSRAKVKNIFGLVSTDPTVNQLLSPSHRDLLVHIKVRSSQVEVVHRVLRQVKEILRREFRPRMRKVVLAKERDKAVRERAKEQLVVDTADHVITAARLRGHAVRPGARRKVIAHYRELHGKPPRPTPDAQQVVRANLTSYLTSGEFPGEWPQKTPEGKDYDRKSVAGAIAAELARLGPQASEDARDLAVKRAAGKVLGGVACVDFATFLERELGHSWRLGRARQLGAEAARLMGLKNPDETLLKILSTAALDLDAPTVGLALKAGERAPGMIAIRPTVSGMPAVLQGLARSVEKNQIYSLVVSLAVVFLIMVVMFRSLLGGLVALLPAGLTLVTVFAGLSLTGRHLDISTSMVAGIAIGVGIDYAIHFLSWWQRRQDGHWDETARAAARISGGGIVANAFMVCAGFAVLALGEAQPLKVLGIMIASAMIMAAVITFLVVPASAGRRVYYDRSVGNRQVAPAPEAVEVAPMAEERSLR